MYLPLKLVHVSHTDNSKGDPTKKQIPGILLLTVVSLDKINTQ